MPLLERMRFCAIYEDNLDEFYMVRIAGMHDQVEANLDARGADGVVGPRGDRACPRARRRAAKAPARCFEDELQPQLAEHGIRILDLADASASEHEELDKLFKDQVFPALTPLVIGRGRPFPYISNLSLSLVVLLRNPEKDEEVVARVKVPKELLRRFLAVGEDDTTFIPIEQLIADNLEELFPGMEIVHHSLFRVTRDTDYDVSDEAADLLQAVEEEVRRRRFGEVVRLEVSSDMEPRLRDVLIDALKITDEQVYDVEGLIGLDDLNDIVEVPGHGDLRYAPWNRRHPSAAPAGADQARGGHLRGDPRGRHPRPPSLRLLRASVERFVTQAVEDPNVLAIKQTVYRTSSDSPLVTGLIEATERGKQAVCLVELKARFDESANIGWARSLEEAGVHVVYGIPGLKTHVKCVLVARREGEGVRNYVHIGTGNYNAKTARLYTDVGLFTADERIGEDIAEMFNYLTGYARPKDYDKVMVAPFTLREGILEQIERAIEAHSPEKPGRIRMKMNSLLDPTCIRALYQASQAGVDVQLNVRGICGLSRASRASRRTSGSSRSSAASSSTRASTPSSAPARTERLDRLRRPDAPQPLQAVELLAPVEAEAGREQLCDILDRAFADNTSAWELDSDGAWTRLEPGEGEEPRNLQDEMMRLHSRRSEAAASQVAVRALGSLARVPLRSVDHKDRVFFDLFAEAGQNTCARRGAAERMFETGRRTPGLARELLKAEQEGDRITQQIARRLNSDPPRVLESSEVYSLATRLDDVVEHRTGPVRRGGPPRLPARQGRRPGRAPSTASATPIKLASNENPEPADPGGRRGSRPRRAGANRYPDHRAEALRSAIAGWWPSAPTRSRWGAGRSACCSRSCSPTSTPATRSSTRGAPSRPIRSTPSWWAGGRSPSPSSTTSLRRRGRHRRHHPGDEGGACSPVPTTRPGRRYDRTRWPGLDAVGET